MRGQGLEDRRKTKTGSFLRIRLRYWTGLVVGVLVVAGVARWGGEDAPVDEAPSEAALAIETAPESAALPGPAIGPVLPEPAAVPAPAEDATDWSRVVGGGESLDMLLAEAGLDAVTRARVSEALATEYDLRRLQPGHGVSVRIGADGMPREAALEIENGVRIEARFGAAPTVEVVPPALDPVFFAGMATIGSSVYAALEAAAIPTRFATDLELVLAGTLDLRSALAGGETLRVAWREHRLGDRTIGEPLIDFAQITLADARYEILWPDAESTLTRIYRDDVLVQIFDQPVAGARLSSAFGPRKHPVHGFVRMHSGVDYEAALGARVRATEGGRIVHAGRKSGYGLMVEIDHGGGVQTLYAHLSSVNAALTEGVRVAAGDEIGRVGSTGTSTAPHLHYEIVVDGTPVQPLTDQRLRRAEDADPAEARRVLDRARDALDRRLAEAGAGGAGNEG